MQESYGAGSAHSSTASLLARIEVSGREDGVDDGGGGGSTR